MTYLQKLVEESKTPNQIICCYNCKSKHTDLVYYNERLSDNKVFIVSEEFEQKELEVYKKLSNFRNDINKFKNTFGRLHQYMATMDELTTWRVN